MKVLALPEAERAILKILLEPQAPVEMIMGRLSIEDFYEGMHRSMFEFMKELHDAGRTIEVIALSEKIHTGKKLNISLIDLSNIMCERLPGLPESQICNILQQYRWRREAELKAKQLLLDLYNDESDTEQMLHNASSQLAQITADRKTDYSTLSVMANQVSQRFADNLYPERRLQCVKSGFSHIDDTGGLPPVGITIIAADTSQGKSSLAVDLALENIAQGEKVAFYNLEMPSEDVTRRIIAARTQIPFHHLAYGVPTADELAKVQNASDYITKNGGNQFFFDDSNPDSVEDILGSISRLADPKGAHVTHFYVDYLQILSWANADIKRMQWQSIEQHLAHAARRFHNLCLQLNIQIVLTSQVNRDINHGELTLDRIRDSKQIADAATCVLLLYRPEAYGDRYKSREFEQVNPKGTALFNLAKRRNGPTLKFIVGFDAQRTSFYELDQVPMLSSDDADYSDYSLF